MKAKGKYQTTMEPWPELASFGQKVTLSENKISIFTFSAGSSKDQPIIMVHGLGDEADTWRHIFNPLSENHHVIAMDLPGFGRSDKPDISYSLTFMMSIILELMDTLHHEKAILMGSSLGAILAHQIAIDYPKRVRGLILVGGSILQSDPMGDRQLMLMRIPFIGEWLYTRLRKHPEAAYDSLRNVYHDLDHLPQKDREFLYQRVNERVWSDGQRRAYFSTLRNFIPWVRAKQENIETNLGSLQTPTLLIRGEYDQLFSQKNLENTANYQPDISTATIRDAGHLPHQEKPKAFLEVLTDWLANFD